MLQETAMCVRNSSKDPQRALEDALSAAKATYISQLPTSQIHHERAVQFMPGGNTRSVLHNEPFPVCMKKGAGNRLWDYDGHEYLDLVGEFTAGLYGHCNPILKKCIAQTYEDVGVNLGSTTVQETRLAEVLCARFAGMQQLRFCNSGTEANLYALSVARHMTGKRKVIVFEGGYHGGVLGFGHGIGKNNVDPGDWVLGRYNDVEGATRLIEDTPGVAAVLVEAMQGAGGCIPATIEFLQAIESVSSKHGVLFILDEVMTSRLSPGGLQEKYALKPDLCTIGKYIGGGLAIGAFGGRRELLTAYDPRLASSLPHSGTFNNNTLAMSCGFVGLTEIYTPAVAMKINALGDYLRQSLQTAAKDTVMVITGVGAVLTVHFLANGHTPVRGEDIDEQSISGLKKLFWYYCLGQGFWITERGMLSIVLGTTRKEVDSYIEIVRLFITKYADLVTLRPGS